MPSSVQLLPDRSRAGVRSAYAAPLPGISRPCDGYLPSMLRAGLAIAAGLADSVLRLAFVAAAALAALGVYIALFASLGLADPGHDWRLGLVLTAVGLGASLVVLVPLLILSWNDAHGSWYAAFYGLFFLSLLTLLLVSSGFRLIGDWQRSPVKAAATMSHCETDANADIDCVFSWTWAGVEHELTLDTYKTYPDGTAATMWVDPSTGGADSHSYGPIVLAMIGAGIAGGWTVYVLVVVVLMLVYGSHGLRPWLADRAWWRKLSRRAPPPRAPRPAPPPPRPVEKIADAVPQQVEDARPPGY